jgi:hypothetical protein
MFKKEKIATLCLMAGMFFNPFGFDAVLLIAMKLTGGYWDAIILLYCLVALFATLYYFYRKNVYLMLALFVNPFGYDALFAWTMKQTGSFIAADLIFYGIAFIFFGIYFYLVKLHPIKYTMQIADSFRLKIQNFF